MLFHFFFITSAAQSPPSLELKLQSFLISFATEKGETYHLTHPSPTGPQTIVLEGTGLPAIVEDVPWSPNRSDVSLSDISGKAVEFSIELQSLSLKTPTPDNAPFEIQASPDLEHWFRVSDSNNSLNTFEARFQDTSVFRVVELESESESEPDPTGGVVGFFYLTEDGTQLLNGSVYDPPENATPANGATGQIVGTQLSGTADEDGRLIIRGVPVGSQVMHVSKDGLSLMVPLLVQPMADDLNIVGSPVTPRATVIERVKEEILSKLPNPNTAFVYGVLDPLPSETVISTPDPFGLDPAFNGIKLFSPSWFFVIDEHVTQGFGHALTFVIIDDESGEMNIHTRYGNPAINGFEPWGAFGEVPDPNIVQIPTEEPTLFELAVDITEAPRAVRDSLNSLSGARVLQETPLTTKRPLVFAIFIVGGLEEPFTAAMKKVKASVNPDFWHVFNAGQGDDLFVKRTKVKGKPVPKITYPYQDMLQIFYSHMAPDDTLFIYVNGHHTVVGGLKKGDAIPDKTKLGGEISFGNSDGITQVGNEAYITMKDLAKPLAKLPSCNLVMFLDSCFSGSLLRGSTTFDVPVNKSLINNLMSNVPKSVSILALTSANDRKAAKYTWNYRFIGSLIERSSHGSDAGNQMIQAGVLPKGLNQTVAAKAFTNAILTSGTPMFEQGADIWIRAGLPSIECGKPILQEEEEPNDKKEQANLLKPNEDGEIGCVGSIIDETDVDTYLVSLPEDCYLFTVDDVINQMIIELEDGRQISEGNQAYVQLDAPQTVSVTMSGQGRGNYIFDIQNFKASTGLRFENTTDHWIAFRIVTNEVAVNEDRVIRLNPGESYSERFASTLTGLNMVDLHRASGAIPFGSDGNQGFQISINEGRRWVFRFGFPADEFFTEPLN